MLLYECIAFDPELSQRNLKFRVFIDDIPPLKKWCPHGTISLSSPCRAGDSFYLPFIDFGFHSWPGIGIHNYQDLCKQLLKASSQPVIDQRVFWAGTLSNTDADAHTRYSRRHAHEIGQAHSNLLNIVAFDWENVDTTSGLPAGFLELTEHAQFGGLLDLEGGGYSARLKYLLHLARPILIQDRPINEYWHVDLVPWQHYIPVRADLSDLQKQAQWLMDNPDQAKRIALNGQKFAIERLNKDAAIKHFRSMLKAKLNTNDSNK